MSKKHYTLLEINKLEELIRVEYSKEFPDLDAISAMNARIKEVEKIVNVHSRDLKN